MEGEGGTEELSRSCCEMTTKPSKEETELETEVVCGGVGVLSCA